MWSDSASGKEKRQAHFPVKYKKAEGKFPLPADNDRQHPHPQPLFPHSRSSTIMIQQLSPFPHPPQLLPHPQLLFPHRHRRMMIQRILQQELFPPESPHPLLQPHPLLHPHPLSHPQPLLLPQLHPHPPLSSHPQFVAAKSLMLNPPEILYTPIICERGKCVTVNGVNNNRRLTIM